MDLRLRDELPASVLPKFEAPKGFPVSKEMKHGQFQFQMEQDKPFQAQVLKEEALGRRYEREDGSEVVQLRRNGLTYSILKNYTSWDVLMEAARSAWQHFLAVSGPVNVSRLAVRYINAIDLPPGAELDDYLTSGPRIPSRLPQIVAGLFQRVVIPFADADAQAIITQALETASAAGHLLAVLDIDVFSECSFDGKSAEVWSRLEKMRSIKNDIFFSSLTAKAVELYI